MSSTGMENLEESVEENANPTFFDTLASNPEVTAVLVFFLITAFLYAALGRAKIFHHHTTSRLVVSGIIGFYTSSLISQQHLPEIMTVAAGAIAAGLIGLLVWSVGLQRGKIRKDVGGEE